MEAIIAIRDAELIMQKPHRFPKRARKVWWVLTMLDLVWKVQCAESRWFGVV
jgi:hypothetical protein